MYDGTMVFMHHPLWAFGEANGFNEVEAALEGRNYTVFAGHTHKYLHEVRNDQNHYVLATTGGGSKLRGPKFGEFDHIGWVTMTDSGPELVNLALSGILEHNISNQQTTEQAVALIQAADFKPLVLFKGKERKIILSFSNPSDKTLYFRGRFYHNHQVEPDNSDFSLELPPQSRRQWTVKTTPIGNVDEESWDPLEMDWEMGYDSAFMEPKFRLSGSKTIELDSKDIAISITEQDIFLKDLKVEMEHPYENLSLKYTTDGTDPGKNGQIYREYLGINESTTLKAVLCDTQGFESGILVKEFEKVDPVRAIRPKGLKKGLDYSYYEGNFTMVPDFKNLNPLATGVALELDPDKLSQRLDHYAIQYQGYFKVPTTDVYTFYLTSDDGSKLYINDGLVIDNDGSHSDRTKKGRKALKKGWHRVRIDYFEDFLGERLELEYATEGMEKSNVIFWH